MKLFSRLIYLGAICILGLSLSQAIHADENKKKVLVLHSYHQGYHWTDRIMAGIESGLKGRDDVELFTSYMDTKRRSGDAYFKQLRDLYAIKYQFTKFDAIISSDDHALDFLLEYRDDLFPETPVVFSGLNDFTPSRLKNLKKFTGIYESYDVTGTVELMLELHPETESIFAITDETLSGQIFKGLVQEAGSKLIDRVKINYLHNLSPKNLQETLVQLPDNSLVLWVIYLRMPSGGTLSSPESVRLITEASQVPTYTVWDVVGQGVVGGKITSPKFQGENAAEITLRILQGESIENIPVRSSPLVYKFDFKAMQRFGLSSNQIPEPSIILNKPESFYDIYKRYVWILSGVLILLLTIIAFLVTVMILNRNRDKYERMAMQDHLTGLYNRHYLECVAPQKLSEAIRHHQSIFLLMLDLDLFKIINDTHGHSSGDDVLREFATLLKEQNRSEDIVSRIGGEEFVIILGHCNAIEAKRKAQLIRKKVTELEPDGIPITVSIGMAELNPKGETFSELLERADTALYQAKANGRNCVVSI